MRPIGSILLLIGLGSLLSGCGLLPSHPPAKVSSSPHVEVDAAMNDARATQQKAAASVAYGVPVDATRGTAVLTQSAVQAALTAQGYTTTRAGYLDTLNGLVSAIWSAATRTLSAFSFTVATNSDANVTAIKAKTDNLPASPAPAGDQSGLTAYGASKLTSADITNAVIPLV